MGPRSHVRGGPILAQLDMSLHMVNPLFLLRLHWNRRAILSLSKGCKALASSLAFSTPLFCYGEADSPVLHLDLPSLPLLLPLIYVAKACTSMEQPQRFVRFQDSAWFPHKDPDHEITSGHQRGREGAVSLATLPGRSISEAWFNVSLLSISSPKELLTGRGASCPWQGDTYFKCKQWWL